MTTYTADDFKNARFATHPDGRIAMRRNPGKHNAWFTSNGSIPSDINMAQVGWVPVRECPDPEVHEGRGDDDRTIPWKTAALNWEYRAEKAEKERDENGALHWLTQDALRDTERQRDDAQAYAALWKETARREVRKVHDEDGLVMRAVRAAKTIATENGFLRDDLAKAEQQRDRWKEVAEVNQEELDHLHSDTPRPLTADDITDEMVERAERFAGSWGNVPSRFPWRALLTAALTEPPSRPEGAEDLETVIGLSAGKWTTGAEDVRALADLLASRGVRVTGGK